MKNGLWVVSLIFLLTMGCTAYALSPGSGYSPGLGGQYGGNQQQYGQYGTNRQMDMRSIYNYLAPYGRWIYLEPYGFVWTPRHMGSQWRPYRNGRWVMTEMGWTWIARERWGAIPFHYGRWGYNRYFGWFWVPGRTWGPAWVSWRWNDQYAGWAPLQPGIEIRAGMDYTSISINIPNLFWTFLQTSHFLDPDINSYALPYERNAALCNSTSMHDNNYFRNDRIYNEGIAVDLVRRLTQRDVPQYTIQDAQQPGLAKISGKQLQIYRPTIQADSSAKPQEFLTADAAGRELAPVNVVASQKKAEQAKQAQPAQQVQQNKQAKQDQKDKQAKQTELNKQAHLDQQDKQAKQAEQNKKAKEVQQNKEDNKVQQVQEDKQGKQDKQDKQAEKKKKKNEGNA